METHFIDINLFDFNKLDCFDEKNENLRGYKILTYKKKHRNNFGLFINTINDYCFENNILYFNLENNDILQKLEDNINHYKKVDADIIKTSFKVFNYEKGEYCFILNFLEKYYKKNFKFCIKLNEPLILKSKKINIDLEEKIYQNKELYNILNKIDKQKYSINIGISFDIDWTGDHCGGDYIMMPIISYIKIIEPLKIIYINKLNKTKKITLKNGKIKNIEKIEENKNEENKNEENDNKKIKKIKKINKKMIEKHDSDVEDDVED